MLWSIGMGITNDFHGLFCPTNSRVVVTFTANVNGECAAGKGDLSQKALDVENVMLIDVVVIDVTNTGELGNCLLAQIAVIHFCEERG
ncbi:hypothetical protein OTK58_05480 [Vibrio barjaei]|nr:hypothetical protein [Vibrio barjaei]